MGCPAGSGDAVPDDEARLPADVQRLPAARAAGWRPLVIGAGSGGSRVRHGPRRPASGGVAGPVCAGGRQPRDVPDRQRVPGAPGRRPRPAARRAPAGGRRPFVRAAAVYPRRHPVRHVHHVPAQVGERSARHRVLLRAARPHRRHVAAASCRRVARRRHPEVRAGRHAVGGAVLRHHGSARPAQGDRPGTKAGAHQLAAEPVIARLDGPASRHGHSVAGGGAPDGAAGGGGQENCRRRPSPRGCSRSAASTRPPRRATG